MQVNAVSPDTSVPPSPTQSRSRFCAGQPPAERARPLEEKPLAYAFRTPVANVLRKASSTEQLRKGSIDATDDSGSEAAREDNDGARSPVRPALRKAVSSERLGIGQAGETEPRTPGAFHRDGDDGVPAAFFKYSLASLRERHDKTVARLEARISELSATAESANDKLHAQQAAQQARKEAARQRAIARDEHISALEAECEARDRVIHGLNTHVEELGKQVSELSESRTNLESQLKAREDALDRQSRFSSSQGGLIKQLRAEANSMKAEHQAELEAKNHRIGELESKNAALTRTLESEGREKAALEEKIASLTDASRQFTPAKSEALSKTTAKLADEAERYRALNTTLVQKLRVETKKNDERLAEVQRLKSALMNLAARLDIPLEVLTGGEASNEGKEASRRSAGTGSAQ